MSPLLHLQASGNHHAESLFSNLVGQRDAARRGLRSGFFSFVALQSWAPLCSLPFRVAVLVHRGPLFPNIDNVFRSMSNLIFSVYKAGLAKLSMPRDVRGPVTTIKITERDRTQPSQSASSLRLPGYRY